MENKKYCFTEQEFIVLAGSANIEKLYGFLPVDRESLDGLEERTLHQLLFQMTRKQFLETTEYGYQMVPQLRELFWNIRIASKVITVSTMKEGIPNKCIYLGESAVLVEEGGINKRILKSCFGAKSTILNKVLEETVPLQGRVNDLLYQGQEADLEKLQDKDLPIFLEQLYSWERERIQQAMEEFGIQIQIQCWEKESNSITERLWIAIRPVYDLILYLGDKGLQIYLYSFYKLKELLKKMMDEESRGKEHVL